MSKLVRLSRRSLLKNGTGAALAALIFGGCEGCQTVPPPVVASPSPTGSPAPPLTPSPVEGGPYAVWREVREALRQSPDHPVGRAALLAEKGDLAEIHRFVRDQIRLCPGEAARFAMGSTCLWGPRAALRAGAGTAREKAEILAQLFRLTGAEATVVEVAAPSPEKTPQLFFRNFESSFEPAFTEQQLSDWRERLNASSDLSPLPVDPEGSEAEALAQVLLTRLRPEMEKLGRSKYDDRPVGRLPVVKLKKPDGTVVYADPNTPGVEMGPLAQGVREQPAGEIKPYSTVKVGLSAIFNTDPKDPVELVTGEWSFDQLAGRQLRLGFLPAVPLKGVLSSRYADVQTFVPALSLQALDGPEEKEPPVLGDAFTLGGERLKVEPDGSVTNDGYPLLSAGPLADGSAVKSLEIQAEAGFYPRVKLKVTPRGEAGKIVENLPADLFGLTDQEQPVGFTMTSNVSAPRLLFLSDQSLSMPESFRGGGKPLNELYERVRTIAREVHPQARVELRITGSNLWEELERASTLPLTLVIFATDGNSHGRTPDEKMRTALKAGPPALILDVYGSLTKARQAGKTTVFDELAEATNGRAYPVEAKSTESAESIIRQTLAAQPQSAPYQFEYIAPTSAESTHQVELFTREVRGATTYEVPDSPALSRTAVSLRLKVTVGKHTVERVVAGWNGIGLPAEEHANAVHGAMFGAHTMAFEGPPPSLSVLLDDMLQAKLGVENLDRAAASGQAAEIEARLDEGIPFFPGELASLLQATDQGAGQDYCTTQLGLRTVLHSAYPVLDSNRFLRRVDIMPLEQAHALAEERARTVELTLRSSVGLALIEAELFPRSTYSLLQGKELVPLDRDPFKKSGLEPKQVELWKQLIEGLRRDYPHPGAVFLGPSDGSELALWAVQRASGEMLGVLPDGSGGGEAVDELPQAIKRLDLVIANLNILATLAGSSGAISSLGGVSLGIVAAYGQQLARLYAAVSLTIMLMNADKLDDSIREIAKTLACEVCKNITLGVWAKAGSLAEKGVALFTATDNAFSVAFGRAVVPCP